MKAAQHIKQVMDSNPDEASNYLSGIPADMSYVLQVADARGCLSVERATFGARVRASTQNGVRLHASAGLSDLARHLERLVRSFQV